VQPARGEHPEESLSTRARTAGLARRVDRCYLTRQIVDTECTRKENQKAATESARHARGQRFLYGIDGLTRDTCLFCAIARFEQHAGGVARSCQVTRQMQPLQGCPSTPAPATTRRPRPPTRHHARGS
jgi:hypothetical protein